MRDHSLKLKSGERDLPDYVRKYFWGDDLNELSWKKHEDYIAKVLLERGDEKAVKWLLKKMEGRIGRDVLADIN